MSDLMSEIEELQKQIEEKVNLKREELLAELNRLERMSHPAIDNHQLHLETAMEQIVNGTLIDRIKSCLKRGSASFQDLQSMLGTVSKGSLSATLHIMKKKRLIKGKGPRRSRIYSLR